MRQTLEEAAGSSERERCQQNQTPPYHELPNSRNSVRTSLINFSALQDCSVLTFSLYRVSCLIPNNTKGEIWMPRTFSSHRLLLQLCVVMVQLTTVFSFTSKGQEPDSTKLPGLQWRLIGPFRAGRVTAVAGVPGDPNTYYFGTPGGGVWKTSDGGQV